MPARHRGITEQVPKTGLDRRSFLRAGAAGGLALGLSGVPLPARGIERYVPLGATGLEISDVSFGSSRLRGEEALVHRALDLGINYFDTAESYTGGRSEETLGRALVGRREQVILATKVHCGASDRVPRLMRRLEGSLERLRTDRVEVYFNHAVNSLDRVSNPEWHEFVDRAREQGKIRFSGVSGHGGQLIPCLEHVIDEGRTDVLLVSYNFGQDPAFYERFTRSLDLVARQPDLPRVLRKARERKIGIVAMKTLMGARLNDMRPFEDGGATFAQAAFRWVLTGGLADALVVTMRTGSQLEEYAAASGARPPGAAELRLLERYARSQSELQCRYGCDACSDACPSGVAIPEVLRTRMYARDYEDAAFAKSEYRGVSPNAASCLSCSERSCAGRCPYGLRLDELVPDTHRELA